MRSLGISSSSLCPVIRFTCWGTGVLAGSSCMLSESEIIEGESLLLLFLIELSGRDCSSFKLSTFGGVALIRKGST